MTIKTVVAGAVLATAFAVVPAYAEDLVFMLDNKASISVREFYASAVNVDNWEEDILGQDILEPNNFARITISNSQTCEYDLKIVFDNDRETEERGINLCDTGSYTVSDPE
jgi:hypothetical protein